MKKINPLTILSVTLFMACKKDNATIQADYYPMGKGSTWTYRDKIINKIFTVEELDKDSIINGKTYKVCSNTIAPNFYKYKANNGDGYRFDILATTALGTATSEQLVYKNGAEIGDTWTVNFTSASAFIANDSAMVRVVTKMMSADASKVVNGIAYNNLIYTASDLLLAYKNNPTYNKVGTVDFYFAANIGLVYYKVTFLPPVSNNLPNREVEILSYNIKK